MSSLCGTPVRRVVEKKERQVVVFVCLDDVELGDLSSYPLLLLEGEVG